MTPAQILAPLTLAAVVAVSVFALLWRAGRESDRVGTPTWWFLLVMTAYAVPVVAFLYFSGGKAVFSGFDIFMAALAANAFAVGIVYALMSAFVYTRGQPILDRIPTMLGALFLLGVVLAGTIQLGHG